ncbi:MAG: DUF4373 domain-containing protein [Bacteroidales bacterium]|nr:DUF4373 domain-containing protein [Lachnoclostridium sp.]MCM1385284.1 DUF4373 domain-containing protein [Lachnoclostridium sp.]MCM1466130.1 DUF4373 domain-containing protein [Bacteroidales bacterium]
MAGKPKKRIDYAGWSVDIFSNDIKIDKLLDAQGWQGFGVYFYLCQMAFGSEGYYYEWCYDLCATTARKMGGGVGAGTVKEAVDYCLQIGLFDKGLFDRWGVLTSRGIQKSYLVVLKNKNRKGTEIYRDYWLLDTSKKEDYQGVVFVHKNSHSLGENSHSLGENSHSLEQKESKVKESKVKENNMCKAEASALFEKLWSLYPCKKGKGRISDAKKLQLFSIGFEEMSRAIERYKRYVESIDYLQYQNGSTFFNSGYIDYLDANYTPAPKKQKNNFNNFEHHNYNFDELERELLENG